jgi:hypothetical protein
MQSPTLRVQDGSVRIYRILDVADGIDLARAEALAQVPKSRVRLASPRSAIEIPRPPLRLGLGARDVRVAGQARRVEVQVSLFDYGVASFLFELPVVPGASIEELVPLAEALLERPTPELDEVARGLANELWPRRCSARTSGTASRPTRSSSCAPSTGASPAPSCSSVRRSTGCSSARPIPSRSRRGSAPTC